MPVNACRSILCASCFLLILLIPTKLMFGFIHGVILGRFPSSGRPNHVARIPPILVLNNPKMSRSKPQHPVGTGAATQDLARPRVESLEAYDGLVRRFFQPKGPTKNTLPISWCKPEGHKV